MAHYSFVTHWSFPAPVEAVWEEIVHPLEWPKWWPGVEQVVELEPGGVDGMGGLHRSVWKSVLPYRLRFDSRVSRIERCKIYAVEVTGQLKGRGLWSFSAVPEVTQVRYDWDVEATKWWMTLLSPLARPLFAWNHDVVMRRGREGLARRLAARTAGQQSG
jgi:hypothetical protein